MALITVMNLDRRRRVGYNKGFEERAGDTLYRQRVLDVRVEQLKEKLAARNPERCLSKRRRDHVSTEEDCESDGDSSNHSDSSDDDVPSTSATNLPHDIGLLDAHSHFARLHPFMTCSVVTPRDLRSKHTNSLRNFLRFEGSHIYFHIQSHSSWSLQVFIIIAIKPSIIIAML